MRLRGAEGAQEVWILDSEAIVGERPFSWRRMPLTVRYLSEILELMSRIYDLRSRFESLGFRV